MTDSLLGRRSAPADRASLDTARVAPARVDPPAARTLVDVFADTVARFGERTAVDAPDALFTYQALSGAVRGVADRLNQVGIGPGDRVGVRIPSGTSELYVAILGVLTAGAAYVPADADDPPARAEVTWSRAGACAVLESGLELTVLSTPHGAQRPLSSDDDAWIIFTSGSTGEPKGVAVSHRSAAAFVDAETELWDVAPDDRVLAGLSVGFDASCEEMWLAWRNGATLVPAPRTLVRAAADLGPWLAERGVTVISTVPTLATMWADRDLEQVRLLILGGEACPDALAWRLARGREVWNTYGPTEATVVSTAARLHPGRPVTIGWPLRGWETAIVDQSGEPVALGDAGELVIGGAGLARYLDSELDRRRYAPLPALGWERAYRTGDIVRETIEGIQFIGRRDDQVKLGGRRLELGEITAELSSVPGVRAAAAAVQRTPSGNPVLVGYVTGEAGADAVRSALAERLPEGIVPLVVELDELPVTAAGKVDRRALPWPPPARSGAGAGAGAGTTSDAVLRGTAGWLADRWADQLGTRPAGPESDFFTMGGSSLAAAKLVSVLRERYPAIAVADVYEHRTLAEMAARLDRVGESTTAGVDAPIRPPLRFGLMQLAGLLAMLAMSSVPWILAVLAYGEVVNLGLPRVGWLWLIAAWLGLASPPAHTAMYILARHALLRDLNPGRYPRYSGLAARLWFIGRFAEITHLERLGGTPWVDRYARLMRVDVGEGARLATVPPAGALLHVGPGANVEGDVDLQGSWIDGPDLVVGAIYIGAGARVGSRTLLEPGTVIGEGAEIEPGSVVSGTVPSGEHWGGAPAVRLGAAGTGWPEQAPEPSRHPRFWRSMFALGLGLEGVVSTLAFAPIVLLDWALGAPAPTLHSSALYLVGEVGLAFALTIPTLAILVALTLRGVFRLVKPGLHPDDGAVAWALWFAADLREMAGTILFPLYASLFTAPWLRLMGIRVGRRAELSTSTGLNPLVSIGELCQATDDVGFCGVRSRGRTIQVEPITVGNRTFIGPSAILRGQTRLGDDSLIGAMTLAPRKPAPKTSWFGVPPLELPRVPDPADRTRTVAPPRRLVAARAAMDVLRILGPSTLAGLLGIADVAALVWLSQHAGLGAMIGLAPLVMLVSGVIATLLTVALKWLVIGRYRSGEHPLWSFFVWRDELINTAQEVLAGPALLAMAEATPLMSLYLRAMGARVGRGVWCETMAITEYDMVELGDGTVINRHSCLMTHLFHDRLLRIGPTFVGAGATLGPRAAVLPDTRVGAGTSLAAHSVVLRGEELPAGTRWQGAPVRSL